MKILVSVIMSTLNTKEEYLISSVNSILNQSYTNFELIIVVDGGNDYLTLNKFKDERIKIIKHEKSIGLPASLNEAISISNGKYIMRMDSDDISDSKRIEKQLKFMELNTELDMSATYYREFGNQDRIVKEIFSDNNKIAAKTYYINPIAHPTVMFKKEFLDKNNIRYNEEFTYSQDFELWTRIIKKGKIGILKEILLNYRIHESQISKEKYNVQSKFYYEVLKRNLSQLRIDEKNIDFLLMLNNRNKDIDIKGLAEFIQLSINQNKILKCYDIESFEEVLKIAFVSLLIKNKKFLNKYIWINFLYVIKLIYLKLKK